MNLSPAAELALARAERRLAPQEPTGVGEPLHGLPVPRRGITAAVLVGPGVVRQGQVAALHDFVALTGACVVNTWGAKGVFRWDSPHHGGTAGLQRDDWELAGLYDADIVVTSGLDPDETREVDLLRLFARAEVVDLPPSHLRFAAGGWPPPRAVDERPPLYGRLAEVVGPMYRDEASIPQPPPRAASLLAKELAPGSLVSADAGLVGFWVARTFATTEPGSVVVPAGDDAVPGFAVAAALVAARAGRPQVAVVGDALDDVGAELAALAASEGHALDVRVWGLDSPTPVDLRGPALDALVEVAGPITAWG